MKKILAMLLVLALSLSVCACGGQNTPTADKPLAGTTLKVYNWGEYIDEDVIGMFEDETGIKVVYDTFETNEDMYTKLKASGTNTYDVCIPSDYMIKRMIDEDMLEKIDFSNVQIEPLFQDQVDFDTFSKSDFRAVKVKECEAVKKSKKLLKFVLDDGTGIDRVILSGIHEYYEPEELVGKTCIAITNLPPRAMMGIDSCGMLISAVHHENGEERLHLLMVDPHIPAGAKLY